jgi:A/G-specific adenine glycosylase
VDGNVLRVISRITGDDADIAAPPSKSGLEPCSGKSCRTGGRGLQPGLMELGATVCLPNGAPLCEGCPASAFCTAHLAGKTARLPVKSPKKARRIEERTVYLIFHDHRVALRRRPERGLLAGLWEFPNEPGDATGQHLETWGIPCRSMERGRTAKHVFTHIEWHMQAVVISAADDALPPGWVWADRAGLRAGYALPNAFHPFWDLVERHL